MISKWFKSWTINYAMLLSIAGIVQANLQVFNLNQKQMGVAMIILGVITAILRGATEQKPPLDER